MSLLDVSVAILVLLIAFYFAQWFKYRWKKLPPGPLGLPVVGYLPFLSSTSPHHSLTQLCRKFGPIYSVRLGSVFTVVLSDVKLVRQAFALESLSGRAPLYLTHGIMKGNEIKLHGGDTTQNGKNNRVTIIGGLAEAAHGSTTRGNSSSRSNRILPNWDYLSIILVIGHRFR